MMKLICIAFGIIFFCSYSDVEARIQPDDIGAGPRDRTIGVDLDRFNPDLNPNFNPLDRHTSAEDLQFGKRSEAAGSGDPASNVHEILKSPGFPYTQKLQMCLRGPAYRRLRRCRCFFMWLRFCWGRPIFLQHPLCPCYYWCRWW